MRCRNGHEIEARVPRADGYSHCPVCKREGQARRDRARPVEAKRARWARDNERKRMAKVGW